MKLPQDQTPGQKISGMARGAQDARLLAMGKQIAGQIAEIEAAIAAAELVKANLVGINNSLGGHTAATNNPHNTTLQQAIAAGALATSKPEFNAGAKLGTACTAGDVWTATDALGNGTWQASTGGGGGGGMTIGDPITGGTAGRVLYENGSAGLANTQGFEFDGSNLRSPSLIVGPAAPSSFDDEFTAAALDAKWSWVNQGTATATLENSFLKLLAPVGASNDNHRLIVQNISGPTWRVVAPCSLLHTSDYNGYTYAGIVARESGSGKLETLSLNWRSGSFTITQYRWNSATSYNSTVKESTGKFVLGRYYLAIERTATALRFEVSFDGRTWMLLESHNTNAFFTSAPDQVGLWVSSFNSTDQPALSADWIRKVS